MGVMDLVKSLREVQGRIEQIRSIKGATLSRDILEERNEIEGELHGNLIAGETLK